MNQVTVTRSYDYETKLGDYSSKLQLKKIPD